MPGRTLICSYEGDISLVSCPFGTYGDKKALTSVTGMIGEGVRGIVLVIDMTKCGGQESIQGESARRW